MTFPTGWRAEDLKAWALVCLRAVPRGQRPVPLDAGTQPQRAFSVLSDALLRTNGGAQLGGEGYLATIGRELLPEIDVFWTGPEIISREITVAHVRELRNILRRKPLIWDNLHANDYDGRRFYCGPYAGRPPELRDEVSGLLSNPNNEFPLNYVPLPHAGGVRAVRRRVGRRARLTSRRCGNGCRASRPSASR